MPNYQCIGCGAQKEGNNAGSCPVCGYRMFETPYDRADVLRTEIKRFLSELGVTTITREELEFPGKAEDEQRFPSYDRIRQYVQGQKRTEGFLDCLIESVTQLKRHFTTPFSNTYAVSFQAVDAAIAQRDAVLREAAQLLCLSDIPEPEPVTWGEVSLRYHEIPDQYLWYSANDLLDKIEALANKIVRFVKQNNLYGQIQMYDQKQKKAQPKEPADVKDELEQAIAEITALLKKQYVVDILDDGTAELSEMLEGLWAGVALVMRAPLFLKIYDYVTGNEVRSEREYFEAVSQLLSDRYRTINRLLDTEAALQEKTEAELFELYTAMIGLDRFGILVPVGTELRTPGAAEKKLDAMIGLDGIKESIRKIKAYALSNKDNADLNIHMCFLGNPGTGKTEVARHIADILYENDILPTNRLVEVDRSGLVSEYFGATAEKTREVIARALGGVLFIDEAYALYNNDSRAAADYGKEAIDTLVKAMEDYRGKFCVIFAGYQNEMLRMLSINPGLQSRIQFTLDFPNYSREELKRIAELMLQRRRYTIGEAAMNRILDITEIKRKAPNFANAREIRNILDQVIMCQNLRCAGTGDKELGLVDVNKYIADNELSLPMAADSADARVLTGEEELDRLVGLAPVKRMVRKIKAYAKRNKGEAGFHLHMCFYGNPGTGKTEVARILSRILHDAGVLAEAKLVETDGRGLLGSYVGETAPKTTAKINEAMNGILFIDEAYGLLSAATPSGGLTNYGEEAVTVLLKEMEDRRGQFCVILAGYKDEMKRLLATNPGFASRIQFTLDFPDYTREELGEIAKAFLAKKKYAIDAPALERLLDAAEYYRSLPNFANARTIRNIVDQVLMNQNLRTEDHPDDRTVLLEDVEDYLTDENIDLANPYKGRNPIGFA